MALINCPECNREVSDTAEICPKCGFGVAKFVERQKRIAEIQEEAEKEAYLYVKQRKKEEREKAEREKRSEEDRKNSIYDEAVSKYAGGSSKDAEKAKELFLSISGWKDSEEYINKCTDRISELVLYENIREEKSRRQRNIIICVTVIIGICAGLIFGGTRYYKNVVVPQNIYELAMSSIQNEDYEEAINLFSKIENYKDSEIKIKETRFYIANKFLENGDYEKAMEGYLLIEDYEGVEEKINETNYKIFVDSMHDKNFSESLMIMKLIPDSSEFYNKCSEMVEENDEEIINELKNNMLEGKFQEALDGYVILQKIVKSNDLLQEIMACQDMIGLEGIWYKKNGSTSLQIDGWNMYFEGRNFELEPSMYFGRFAVKSKNGNYVLQYNSNTQIKLYEDGFPYTYIKTEEAGVAK